MASVRTVRKETLNAERLSNGKTWRPAGDQIPVDHDAIIHLRSRANTGASV
jgi:hypothetical protein